MVLPVLGPDARFRELRYTLRHQVDVALQYTYCTVVEPNPDPLRSEKFASAEQYPTKIIVKIII